MTGIWQSIWQMARRALRGVGFGVSILLWLFYVLILIASAVSLTSSILNLLHMTAFWIDKAVAVVVACVAALAAATAQAAVERAPKDIAKRYGRWAFWSWMGIIAFSNGNDHAVIVTNQYISNFLGLISFAIYTAAALIAINWYRRHGKELEVEATLDAQRDIDFLIPPLPWRRDRRARGAI